MKKKTPGPYKSPTEEVECPEVSSMKLWKLTVKIGSTLLFSTEDWTTEKVLSWDNYLVVREVISGDYGFDTSNLWNDFQNLGKPDNFSRINSTKFAHHSGVVFTMMYKEFPMHPDVQLCHELKDEIKKTLKIYQDEENVFKSLCMSKAVTNLCKYHF